jgi:hypothetical protein
MQEQVGLHHDVAGRQLWCGVAALVQPPVLNRVQPSSFALQLLRDIHHPWLHLRTRMAHAVVTYSAGHAAQVLSLMRRPLAVPGWRDSTNFDSDATHDDG